MPLPVNAIKILLGVVPTDASRMDNSTVKYSLETTTMLRLSILAIAKVDCNGRNKLNNVDQLQFIKSTATNKYSQLEYPQVRPAANVLLDSSGPHQVDVSPDKFLIG